MSASNGVIRIGRKGLKKFAFGEEGDPFEVDVVRAFQDWIGIDASFRQEEGPDVKPEAVGTILAEDASRYHTAAVEFVTRLVVNVDNTPIDKLPQITTAEALDFLARLREQYDELADFFRPKKRAKEELPGTLGVELQFSEEPDPSPTSTS